MNKGGSKLLAALLAVIMVLAELVTPALALEKAQGVTKVVSTETKVYETNRPEANTNSGETAADAEYEAVSDTMNIVGEVLANAFNSISEDPERTRSLLESYPTEEHEPEYYEDSLRIRYLADGEDEPNYLVYRDTFLMIPEEETAGYTVTYSEDGLTAFVAPAIPAEELIGRTGIVFLHENIGCDEVLVFSGEPGLDGDALIVPLKSADEIVMTELFSDGQLAYSGDGSQAPGNQGVGVDFETNPSGTNWEGEITSFEPSWPSASVYVNVWKLKFELVLNLKFDMDFRLHTTGASGGRESVTIAGVHVPIKLFTINVLYKLQTEFYDNVPLEMEGTISTDIDVTMNLIFGTRISKYRNPVVLNRLNILDESWVNRDVRFYIGSQLLIQGGFLEISIDLWFYTVQIGPVLSLNYDNRGGCYVTARLEKDTYDSGQTGQVSIHTCAAVGEPGCLGITIREVHRSSVYFKVDLYFDDWSFYFADSGEVDDGTRHFYNSLTFNSGMKDGTCPHIFYKVPAAVWLDDAMTMPAADMTVSPADALELAEPERALVTSVTGEDGMAYIYLPYRADYRYTLVATGTYNDLIMAGTGRQPHNIIRDENETVNIVLKPDEKITIKTNIVWEVDVDKHEEPTGYYNGIFLMLFRRKAGTDAEWERTDYYWNADSTTGWNVDDVEVPKFGSSDGTAFLYEYRVRIMEQNDYHGYDIISPENYFCYILRGVDAFTDAAGNAEQSHTNKYYISYDENATDETIETTVVGTAVMDVQINKRWMLADPEGKPEYVYLALLQKPATGWENTAIERGVPTDWTLIMNPLSGGENTLKSLVQNEVLYSRDDLSRIENVPLAIDIFNAANDWSRSFMVRKYRSGIRMQYEGYELDNSVFETFLKNEYDLNVSARVASFGDYLSIPGVATFDYDYYTQIAEVINTDPAEHTLHGTVRWQESYWDEPTEYVVLHIKKNGVLIKDITLNKENFGSSKVWFWQLDLEDYDPEAEYTVTETIPFGDEGPAWVGVPYGLDVVNYTIVYDSVQAEAQAVFDIEPDEDMQLLFSVEDNVTGKDGWRFILSKDNGWWNRDPSLNKTEVAEISNYSVDAPDLPGYVTVKDVPYAYTRPGWGNLFYNFTVRYLRKSDNLMLIINHDFVFNGEEHPSDAVPQNVFVDVYRDDVKIATKQIVEEGIHTGNVLVASDEQGNRLSRTDSNGNKYVYTLRPEAFDGFKATVSLDSQTQDCIYLRVTYTWVGSDYMNVAGTVNWEGDEGHESLRPESVQLSVVNKHEEYVKTITVPVNSDGTYEAKYLPGHDAKGNELTYSVIESHVYGYTATYSEPVFDEETRTWTCDVTNKLTGYYPMTVKKAVEGVPDNEEEVYNFKLEPKFGYEGEDQTYPQPLKNDLSITGAGETKAEFFIDEDGIYIYSLKEIKGEDESCEYDEAVREVLVVKSTNPDGTVEFKSWVTKEGDDTVPNDENSTNTAEFTNRYPGIYIEKKWDVDLEGKDRPDSIEVVIQKKDGSKWETVKLVELNEDNDWKKCMRLDGMDDAEIRVRELREETALQELISTLKQTLAQVTEDTYDSWIAQIKEAAGSYYDALPDAIKSAADQGIDKLKEALNAEEGDLFDKLMERICLASAENRIVYDKDDSDKSGKTNEVTFHVGEYVSVLSGGTEDAHVTKYKVSYDKSGNTYKIKNMAILEIDVIKRWIGIGVDDEDMPDSAWVALMCSPKSGALDNAADLASAAGIDIGGVLDYEFPVINPEEGGKDALTLLSELTIGLDISMIGTLAEKIFGVKIPKLAVAKVDKDCDWTANFVISKYNMGVPMDYKGAELWSEVIRQIIKYLIGFSLPVSFNPFDGYFSIPTKAIRTIAGIENPSDILDLSGLAGKALEKAQSLTMDDISNFGWDTLLDDYHLMANVINVKIDWETEDDNTLHGAKIWKDDDESKRPDYITIHVKDGDRELNGSPIILLKSDFAGKDEWDWTLYLPEDPDGLFSGATYVVSEEYPEGFENAEHYSAEIDGLDIINTWSDDIPDTVTISGQKIWQDENDKFGYRPDSITVRLYADGEEVASAVTSSAGGWKYFFPAMPKKDEDGHEIVYTVAEDEVDHYSARVDGFNIINEFTLIPPTIEASRAELRTRPEADSRADLRFIFTVHFNDSCIDYRGNTYGPNENAYKIERIWSVLSAEGRSVTVEGKNIFAMYEDADGGEDANCFTFTAVLVGMRPENFDVDVTAVPYMTYSLDGVSATVNGNDITDSVNGAQNSD